MLRKVVLFVFGAATALLASFAFGNQALAATIPVTTFTDELNANGNCSLREAVRAANTDTAVDACPAGNGADTILLSAGTYALTIPGTNEDASATGDLDILSNINFTGNGIGNTNIDGGLLDRILHIATNNNVNLTGITLKNGGGVSLDDGGGIYNSGSLNLFQSSVEENVARKNAGGIYNTGSLNVVDSKVAFNSVGGANGGGIFFATSASGAISNSLFINNASGYGAAIYAAPNSTINIYDTTIRGNTAGQQGAGIYLSQNTTAGIYRTAIISNTGTSGTGIYNNEGTVTVINSTISSNRGTGLSATGGFVNRGIAQLTNSTLFGNTGDAAGAIDNLGVFRIKNTIVVSNSAFYGQCGGAPLLSQGDNLSSDTDCQLLGPNDRQSANARLGPLQNNGGPTPTHALLIGSPAINGGSNTGCPASDQRGVARPQGVSCDIGAYEFDGAAPSSEWTVMIYLNGDNNLDSSTVRLFNNLEKAVAQNPTLGVVVLWDRFGKSDTVLYRVLPDDNPLNLAPYADGVNRWSMGEMDMGDPTTLIDFINTARAIYPANHYFLSIVNHGGGWSPKLNPSQGKSRWAFGGSGFSWDESNDYHYLATADMKTVFEQVTAKAGPIDVVFYDACLMAMFEEAYQIRDHARYLIASQNESWASYPYDLYLANLTATTTPLDLAKSVARQYHDSLTGYPRTISVFDLQQTNNVSTTLDALSQTLIDNLSSYRTAISQTFLSTQKFDYNFDLKIESYEGYVDLRDFAELLIKNFPNSPISQRAQALLNAMTPFVIQEASASGDAWESGSFWDLERAHGLAIYLPLGQLPSGKTDGDRNYYVSSQIKLAADTRWDDFIYAFLGFTPQPGGTPGGRGNNPDPLQLPTPGGNLPNKVFLPITLRR